MGLIVRGKVSIHPPPDPDAVAFFTASGITDGTQRSAINTLVVDLKRYGLWSKMKAIYPFVGGTASTHKWNLKDPRDLNAAFRLTFSGGWTHSSTGALPNATNSWGNTFIVPSTNLVRDDMHMSFYSRTATLQPSLGCDLASFKGSGNDMLALQLSGFSGTKIVGLIASQQSTAYFTDYATSDARALWTLKRTGSASGDLKLFRNESNVGRVPTLTGGSLLSENILLSAMANGPGNTNVQFWSNKQCAYASIGSGLTDADAANLYTAVQKYQTTLGRQV